MTARGWTDSVERDDAMRLGFTEFHARYPHRSEASWRNFRHSVRERITLSRAETEAIERAAQEAARREAAAVMRERIDARMQELIDQHIAREISAAVTERARFEELLSVFEANLQRVPAFDPPVVPVASSSGTPETMVVLLSDVHVGKLVDPEWVGEGFAYNTSIFHDRLAVWQRKVVELKSIHARAFPIPKLVILLLGDLIDGVDMRRGHGHRVDINSATKQVLVLVQALSRTFADLATVFESVEIVSVPGNHGRVGEYGVNLAMDNWDFMAGKMLELTLGLQRNVSVRVRSQKFDLLQIGPLTTYIAHGDDVGSGGGGFAGIPTYGIARAAAKDTGMHGHIFDLYAIGHYHRAQDLELDAGRVMLNGAWDGGDDFSVNKLKATSVPTQWAFGVHPEHGMTWQYRIRLAGRKRAPSPVASL